jgi:hypothetical protein
MGSLNTALLLAAVTDPTVVLAIWTLACLGALLLSLGTAWAIQIHGDADPFTRRQLQGRVGDLFARHAAVDKWARHRPVHTARAVAKRQAAAASARSGRHHTGERRFVASLIDTQAITPSADVLAAVDAYAERAA